MAAFYQNPLTNEVPARYKQLMSEFAIGEKDNSYAEYRDLNFEHLRLELEASLDAWRSKRGAVGSNAGRPGFDPVFIYTVYFIQNNEGLTNDEMVAEMKTNIGLKDAIGTWHPNDVPKAQTHWTFQEMWAEHRTLERVLDCQLEGMREILPELGEKVVGVDSTFLPVNIPRNTREEK